MTNKKCTIGNISKELGISQRAVRYYEELGFIRPIRTEGGFRSYSEQNVACLKMLISFKELGLSLERIKSLMICDEKGLTFESIHKFTDVLKMMRSDFETKVEKYKDGIGQIEILLNLLSNCTNCGKPSEQGTCEMCLKNQGKEITPIISSIFDEHEKACSDRQGDK